MMWTKKSWNKSCMNSETEIKSVLIECSFRAFIKLRNGEWKIPKLGQWWFPAGGS